MNAYQWSSELKALYDKAVILQKSGNTDLATYFTEDEVASLSAIGLRPINVYDYAEDAVKYGEPDWETFLLVAAARRDYFLHEQGGKTSVKEISSDQLPTKTDEIGGIPWLPRILVKAKCFLEGGLCHDIMYGCGGDRRFLKQHGIHAADLLRIVWAARGDAEKVIRFLRECGTVS
jgi:hypothetical protein